MSSAGIGVSSLARPDGCRVDDDPGLRELGLDDRLVPRHRAQLHVGRAPREELHEPLGPVKVAVEDDDPLEALADEPEDDGAGAAAGAEDDRLARHLLLADERVERDGEARDVGVVPDELASLLRHGVDGARERARPRSSGRRAGRSSPCGGS